MVRLEVEAVPVVKELRAVMDEPLAVLKAVAPVSVVDAMTGLVPKTTLPVPVSSERSDARRAEVARDEEPNPFDTPVDKHVPFIEKQPEAILMPFAAVVVAVPKIL